jgi:hypothetical protein
MELNLALGELQADEDDGVGDDVGGVPLGVDACGGFGEVEDPGDDGFELVEFFADDASVGAAQVAFGEFETEGSEEEFDDGEGVSDFVCDFGGEEAEGGELFAFAEGLLALEDAGVEACVLECDEAEGGEGGGEAFFVVAETVGAVGEEGEGSEDFLFSDEGDDEGGVEAVVVGDIGEFAEFGGADVGELDDFPGVDGGGDDAVVQVEFGGVVQGVRGGVYVGVGEGGEARGAAGTVVEEEGAGAGLHHIPAVADDFLGEGVFIELGDEGETVADEAFELACLAAEVLELPEPLHDGGDFGGELFEES